MVTQEKLEQFSRSLTAKDIQWQVNFQGKSKQEGQLKILGYIDARVCGDRLREDLGIGNFRLTYRSMNFKTMEEGVVASLELKMDVDNTGTSEWIKLEDVCEHSNVSPVKGAVSGALKRVCALLGLGRELYDLPHIYVQTTNKDTIPEWAWSQLNELGEQFLSGKLKAKKVVLTEKK